MSLARQTHLRIPKRNAIIGTESQQLQAALIPISSGRVPVAAYGDEFGGYIHFWYKVLFMRAHTSSSHRPQDFFDASLA